MDAEKMNLGQAALLQQSLWWAPPWPALMGVHALQDRGVSPGIDLSLSTSLTFNQLCDTRQMLAFLLFTFLGCTSSAGLHEA